MINTSLMPNAYPYQRAFSMGNVFYDNMRKEQQKQACGVCLQQITPLDECTFTFHP
jgi:hypothetical protein